VRSRQYGLNQPGIYTIPADGLQSEKQVNGTSQYDSYDPAWSPDGQHIAFTADISSKLFVINADGTNPIMLIPSNTDSHVSCPAWSPDSKRLAFHYGALGGYGTVLMSVEDRKTVGIDTGPDTGGNGNRGLVTTCPIWSPDGKYVVFSSNRANRVRNTCADCEFGGNYDIYAVPADGSDRVQRLTYYHVLLPRFAWLPAVSK
jgi:TolB protein